MDLSEGFGGKRPEHPDFWKLSDVVLMLDADIDPATMTQDQMDKAFVARLQVAGIDRDSLVYMASQRAFRAAGITTNLDLLRPGKVAEAAKLGGVWLDAFAAGLHYERKYGA